MIGREIAGRYRIVKKLGEGGMGAVYRGEQISLKRAVAVKLLRPELGNNQMVLARFNAEAQAVAKLSHPNTVNIYDFGQDTDGSLFIAMELIEGRSLREAIQKEGPFSPARALAIALQVAASLSDAHSHKIVHRDLKPDNVMLQDRGKHKDVVRVLDFGIAKLRDDSRQTQQAMTQAGDMLGTPQYMAPEQIRGEQIDGRTDIYALGCMIYEMVTARLPYEAPTIMAMLSKHLLEHPVPPSQRRSELTIPLAIDQLVLHAMAKDPGARPATMEQFAETLQALLASLPADPNRSGGLSLQQNITPIAPSPFQPPTFPPPPAVAFAPPSSAFTPPSAAPPTQPQPYAPTRPVGQPFAPPSPPPAAPALGQPQSHSYPSPSAPIDAAGSPAKSKAPLWIALGVLALAGAGVGVYLATREDPKPAAKDDPWDKPNEVQPDDHESPDPPQDDSDDPPEPPQDDPWAAKDDPFSASPNTPDVATAAVRGAMPARADALGTNATPIPRGAKLRVPTGFTFVTTPTATFTSTLSAAS